MATSNIIFRVTGDTSQAERSLENVGKKGDQATKSVTNIDKAGKRLTSTFKEAAVAFGAVASVGAAVAGIKALVDVTANFEQSLSGLSAITGAVGEDLKFFEEEAKRIGQNTTLSASEAVTAFQLIGSAKPDLLGTKEALVEVTEQAVLLAEATGLSLPQAADIVGGSLNQFQIDASRTADVVNILAASQKQGSALVADLGDSFKNVGSTASGLGFTFAETNAALQALAAGTLKGAEAGTGLRGVLLKLSTQSNDQFNPQIVGLAQAFRNLGEAGLSPAQTLALVGQEGINTLGILTDQVDIVDRLSTSLEGTNTAQEQARINTDNFNGAQKGLASALEAVQIALGQRILPTLTEFTKQVAQFFRELDIDQLVRFVTQLLGAGRAVASAVAGFIAYRAVVAATTVAIKLNTAATLIYSAAQGNLASITTLFTKAQNAANVAVRSNPLGLLVGLLATATAAYFAFRDSTKQAKEAQDELNETVDRGNDILLGTTELEERASNLESLNKRQTQNFINESKRRLNQVEDEEAKLKAVAKERGLDFSTAALIQEKREAKLRLELRIARDLGRKDDADRASAELIRVAKERADLERLIKDSDVALTASEIAENKKRLQNFIEQGKLRLAAIKDIPPPGGDPDEAEKAAKKLRQIQFNTRQTELQETLFLSERQVEARRNALDKTIDLNRQRLEDGLISEDQFVDVVANAENNLNTALERASQDRVNIIKNEEAFKIAEVKDSKEAEELFIKQANLKILKEEADLGDDIVNSNEETNKRLSGILKKRRGDREKENKKTAEQQAEANRALQDGLVNLANESIRLAQSVTDAQIAQLDRQLSEQESRISRALQEVENGNAQQLILERERQENLEEERRKALERQRALAAVEIAINTAVAVTEAASQTGVGAPVAIALVLAAILGGIASAFAISQTGFKEGGYTGDTGVNDVAGVTHGKEFVSTAETTKKHRKLLEHIHAGRDPMDLYAKEAIMGATIIGSGGDMAGMERRLESIEKAIKSQPGAVLNVDSKGFHGYIQKQTWKQNRREAKL